MLKLNFRQRLLNQELIFGSHISTTDPAMTEIIAHTGLDFVWLDTEHTPIDMKTLENHIARIRQTDSAVVVRARMNDSNHVKRILEMGIDGIVFPYLKSPAEVRNAVRSCLYPPEGTRGFGPRGAVTYGLDNMADYLANANKHLGKIIQLENKEAIDCLPQLLEIPEVDAFLFGPCDLSISYGEPLNIMGGKTREAMLYAIPLIQKAGRSVGISMGRNDTEFIQYCRDLGINMISLGAEFDYVAWEAATYAERVNSFRKKH